jgi:hypothetical protein
VNASHSVVAARYASVPGIARHGGAGLAAGVVRMHQVQLVEQRVAIAAGAEKRLTAGRLAG